MTAGLEMADCSTDWFSNELCQCVPPNNTIITVTHRELTGNQCNSVLYV